MVPRRGSDPLFYLLTTEKAGKHFKDFKHM